MNFECFKRKFCIKEKANQYFYEQDEKRLEMLKDSLTKYFIYEISRIRNLQYDSQRITKVSIFISVAFLKI